MSLNKYLDIAPEVQKALDEGRPVVALESTIISHGMPYPQNVETALNVEKIIREHGATPATIAVIGGRLKAGLSPEEIDYLGKTGTAVAKASRRDLPVLVAEGKDGATTVTTTMIIAHMAGISVFATGGIGGVHRGAQQTFDISADLEELAHTPVMVVCAGAKSILDLGLTLEYLETHGVPVIGYGTRELPAFYTRKSGFAVDYEIDTPEELARAFYVKQDMGLGGGMLVTNPIPEEFSMDADVINKAIDEAVEEANAKGHPRQGDHPLPAGQDQGSHRRRLPGLQHPAGVQQRQTGRCHRCGAQQACQKLKLLLHWTGRELPGQSFCSCRRVHYGGKDALFAGGTNRYGLGIHRFPLGTAGRLAVLINIVTFVVFGLDKLCPSTPGSASGCRRRISCCWPCGRQRGRPAGHAGLPPQDAPPGVPGGRAGDPGCAAPAGGGHRPVLEFPAVIPLSKSPASQKRRGFCAFQAGSTCRNRAAA